MTTKHPFAFNRAQNGRFKPLTWWQRLVAKVLVKVQR